VFYNYTHKPVTMTDQYTQASLDLHTSKYSNCYVNMIRQIRVKEEALILSFNAVIQDSVWVQCSFNVTNI